MIRKACSVLLLALIILGIILFSAACWHSVGEIHYLKSFFPFKFTVEEAFYASAVELIKIIIIGLPILLVLATSLYMLRSFKKDR